MGRDLPFVLIIILPFVGALAVLAARRLGEKAASYLAAAFGASTAVVSFVAFPLVHAGDGALGMAPDGLGYFAALASSVLGSMILTYSLGYMAHGHGGAEYYALILLTIGSTNGVVLSGNALAAAAFWISCSWLTYALISYNRESPDANRSARGALAFARAADSLFVLGLGLLYRASDVKSLQFSQMTQAVPGGSPVFRAAGAYALLLAAAIRSAQVPLHMWLPGAMEAPSPASALLDAATVMNVGVYLVTRFHQAFKNVPGWTAAVLWMGAVTVPFSALMALYEGDLKKMLAYSTMSQLGYMFFAVGTGSILGAQFHMMSHAIFKTLLFLAAGAVIRAAGTKDMGLLSGAGSKMPTTRLCFLAGVMGLSGVPFMSGFFSKDMILDGALSARCYAAFALAALGAVLTVIYSWSAYFKVFRAFRGEVPPGVRLAQEAPMSMRLPMIVLAVLSVGYWLFIGVESRELGYTVSGLGVHEVSLLHLVEETFAGAASAISLTALAVGLALVWRREDVKAWLEGHCRFFRHH